MRVAIISDTHIPARANEIPEWVREEVQQADHTIHAGDFDSRDAFETVQELADDPTVVRGNMDPSLDLPEVETVDLAGVRFVVTHGTGSLDDYRERVAGIVADHADESPTIGVCGHTHQLLDGTVDGIRLLNPGSATGADPASTVSMMSAEVADGEIDVTVHGR
jgi:putative phosphoesterase